MSDSQDAPLILVADAGREARRALQRLLEEHGYRVCPAADGPDALAAAARQPPDLAILDGRLPQLDGAGATRRLKGDPTTRHIPIVLLTPPGAPEALLPGLDAGADVVLSKPVDDAELLLRVRNLLRQKQQHDQARAYGGRVDAVLRATESLRLQPDPQAVVSGTAELAARHLGFGSVVVTLLDAAAGLLRVQSVGGVRDAAARAALLRTTYRWADVRALLRPAFGISESFLIPDERSGADRRSGGKGGAPAGNRWQPEDNLLVPLRAGDGTLLGLLSFDTPADGLRPSPEQVQVLEMFARQAAGALQQAWLLADLHRQYARYVAPAIARQLAGQVAPVPAPPAPVEHELVLMFADLRGFTNLSEGISPQMLVNDVLNPYLARMTEVIGAYEGTVDKFLGDGIMTIFGLPAARGDEAARAIAAGLAMQAAFRTLKDAWLGRLGRDIGMGVGLAIGRAVVGSIGSPQRMDYTAIGSVVNLASRITDLTPSGQVWATGETKLRAETFLLAHPEAVRTYPLAFRPLMPTAIKGASGTQSLYVCLVAE